MRKWSIWAPLENPMDSFEDLKKVKVSFLGRRSQGHFAERWNWTPWPRTHSEANFVMIFNTFLLVYGSRCCRYLYFSLSCSGLDIGVTCNYFRASSGLRWGIFVFCPSLPFVCFSFLVFAPRLLYDTSLHRPSFKKNSSNLASVHKDCSGFRCALLRYFVLLIVLCYTTNATRRCSISARKYE